MTRPYRPTGARLDEAERRVCKQLADGAVFDVRFFNTENGTSFSVGRTDGVAVDPDDATALIINAGLSLMDRLSQGKVSMEDVQ